MTNDAVGPPKRHRKGIQSELQRYTVTRLCNCEAGYNITTTVDGHWVRYEDHERIVADLQAKLEHEEAEHAKWVMLEAVAKHERDTAQAKLEESDKCATLLSGALTCKNESVIELAGENERLRTENAELERKSEQWLQEWAAMKVSRDNALIENADLRKYYRKPTHGPCCTCQNCGQHYDDCRCTLDEVADENEKLKAALNAKEKENAALKRPVTDEEWEKELLCYETEEGVGYTNRNWINIFLTSRTQEAQKG